MSNRRLNAESFYGDGPPPVSPLDFRNMKGSFPVVGDLWIDTMTNQNYIFYLNDNWVPLQTNAASNYNNISNIYANYKNKIVAVLSFDTDNQVVNYGTGFIIAPDGYIVTVDHQFYQDFTLKMFLSDPTRSIYIKLFPENELLPVDVLGIDRKANIAVLKAGIVGGEYLSFRNNRDVNRGEFVISIGQSLNLNTELSYIENLSSTWGVVIDNKYVNDTRYRESVFVNNIIREGMLGGPIFDLNGNVIGISMMSQDNVSQADVDTEQPSFLSNGSLASYIAEPIIKYFLSLPDPENAPFPAGFFGIAYEYCSIETVIYDTVLHTTGPTSISGIQIIADYQDPNSLRYIVNDGLYVGESSENPVIGSPADLFGLTFGDIIICVNMSGQTAFCPIGNDTNSYSFDTVIHLARATGMIDIQYLLASENWTMIHQATGIGLTGIPEIYNSPLNRFT